jgi:gas vesicle protein
MKFVVGLLSGMVIGAVGAVAYSVQSGKDLREAYESVRSDLSKRDLDQLGTRVESAVAEMQTRMDAQIAEVRSRVEAATAGRREGGIDVEVAVDDAKDAAKDAAGTVADAASDVADAVTDAVQPGDQESAS